MSFLWGGGRSFGTPFYALLKDLGLMDNLIFSFRRWLGLSLLGKRADSWLVSSSSKEKRNKTLAGSSSVLVVGNLEGEEESCVCG